MRFSKIVYVVLLYPGIVGALYAAVDPTGPLPDWIDPRWALLVWAVALVAVASLVIASAVRDGARGRAVQLLRSMAWFKFVLIPVFVFNFIWAVALVVGVASVLTIFAGIAGPLAGWFLGATWVVLTYAVFLPTSADGIAFLVVLRRRRQIGLLAFVVHIAAHLLFVTDLISTVALLVTYWKNVMSGGDGAAVGTIEATAQDEGALLDVAEGAVEADVGRVGVPDHGEELGHPADLDPMRGGSHEERLASIAVPSRVK